MVRYLFYVIAFTIVIQGCIERPSSGIDVTNGPEFKLKMDSLQFLESIVNLKKASDNKLAHKYANNALTLAFTINTEEALARAFIIKGIAYKNFNNDSSFIYYSKALKIVESNDLGNLKAKLYYNISMVYLAAGDYKMAIILLDSTKLRARVSKDFVSLSNAFNAIGSIKNTLLDTAESRIMFDSAYAIAVRYNLSKQKGVALASL